MKKSHPTEEADDDDESCFSPFSCLPNDAVLDILKKITDLKTLCVCELVSKRFYEIAHQVDAICYTLPLPSIKDSYNCKSFSSAMTSLKKFDRVKSLCFGCPSSPTQYSNGHALFKWKVKMGKNRVDSVVSVSPTLIYDKKNGLLLYDQAEIDDLKIFEEYCFDDGISSIVMLKFVADRIPSLEKVSIIDSDNRGRVSVNGREKLDELRNWNDVIDIPRRWIGSHFPLLELPVTGYVMKGVRLGLADWDDVPNDATYDSYINL